MPEQVLYKDHAVIFDPNEYGGQDWHSDFVRQAIEEIIKKIKKLKG